LVVVRPRMDALLLGERRGLGDGIDKQYLHFFGDLRDARATPLLIRPSRSPPCRASPCGEIPSLLHRV
jgi:hypothetical protein